ncbi:MAG TPA: TraR/DksA C4-type zinc finger protein [Longimicrobiaceae bacterium]|nr:TraR/DksA C4-type zinc finger protein [Longimicrobiaceae bacterium]
MLTQEERDRIEKLLLREREAALEALGHFEERASDLRERSGEMSLYRFHMADIGTEAQEQEKDFLLASKEGRRLYEVDEALRRLYKSPEDFGTCERCGGPIGVERLEVIPQTHFCVRCQAAVEE